MTETEIGRMIDLLILEVEESGEREGIWFGEKMNTLELIDLLIKYRPDHEGNAGLLESKSIISRKITIKGYF